MPIESRIRLGIIGGRLVAKYCPNCGKPLSHENRGPHCFACQTIMIEKVVAGSPDYYDAEDLAQIMGFTNAESVKRLGRKNQLPPRVPAIKKWLWHKSVIEAWVKGGHSLPAEEVPAGVIILEWPNPPLKVYEEVRVMVHDEDGKIRTETRIMPSSMYFPAPPPDQV
jgi:hypothetical protein